MAEAVYDEVAKLASIKHKNMHLEFFKVHCCDLLFVSQRCRNNSMKGEYGPVNIIEPKPTRRDRPR